MHGVRSAAEHLLVALMVDRADVLCPILMQMLGTLDFSAPTLHKDAVYNAITRCSSFLHDYLDFNTVLLPVIMAELAQPQLQYSTPTQVLYPHPQLQYSRVLYPPPIFKVSAPLPHTPRPHIPVPHMPSAPFCCGVFVCCVQSGSPST